MKNRISELERQIIEKDAVINFLSNQLVNKNLNSDSGVNKTVYDHNNSFQERVDNIVNNNLPLVQHNDYNKKEKSNVIIIGDSVLNNINSRGLSSSNKVSASNFPSATSEDILDEIEDTLKTHPDTLIVHAGTNDLTKNINTLRSIYSEDVSNVSDAQQVLKDIDKNNVNKLIFGQLDKNSLRNKFDMVSELIKGFVDVFMISETKLDDSFPEGQFFIDGYHTLFG